MLIVKVNLGHCFRPLFLFFLVIIPFVFDCPKYLLHIKVIGHGSTPSRALTSDSRVLSIMVFQFDFKCFHQIESLSLSPGLTGSHHDMAGILPTCR